MRGILGAAFVIAWSSGFVGAALGERTGAGVWALLAWRYLVTASVLLLVCLLLPKARGALGALRARDLGQQAVIALLAHVLFLGGVFQAAAQGLNAGLSALVCALQPMLVAATSRSLFGDRLALRQWVGMAIAFGGVALSVGGVGAGGAAGVGLVVAGLAGLSGAALLERSWAPSTPILVSLTVQVSLACGVFLAVALLGEGMTVTTSPQFVAAIGWLVLLSGLGGYATFTACLRRLGATTTSTLLYMTAPVTMLWGWAMFAQTPSIIQWIGLCAVLAGVALAVRHVTP